MKTYYVYILECSDGSYYTGITNNIERRISEHRNPTYKSYTSTRLPVKLVWFEGFKYVYDAIDREKQIKRWRREKKQALIKGEYEKLPKLSRTAKNYDIPLRN